MFVFGCIVNARLNGRVTDPPLQQPVRRGFDAVGDGQVGRLYGVAGAFLGSGFRGWGF